MTVAKVENQSGTWVVVDWMDGKTLNDVPSAEIDDWRLVVEAQPSVNRLTQTVGAPTINVNADGSDVSLVHTVEDLPPQQAKANLRRFAADYRWKHMQKGVLFNGIRIQTTDASLVKIQGALKRLERWRPSVRWKTEHGRLDIDLATMEAIFDVVADFIQDSYDAEEVVEGLIDAGTYTTEAQIQNHSWPTG